MDSLIVFKITAWGIEKAGNIGRIQLRRKKGIVSPKNSPVSYYYFLLLNRIKPLKQKGRLHSSKNVQRQKARDAIIG